MEKKQNFVKESEDQKLTKISPAKKGNEEATKPEKKNKKIKPKLETKSKPEKAQLSDSDSVFIESVIEEIKKEIKDPKTHFQVRPIELDDIPPITPIKLDIYFKYISSQYLKNGDPKLDKDISENFSKYLSESGSIGTILKGKNTLDIVSFLIFLNDAFKKNLTENFGKVIIVLLRTIFPEIKSILTITEEKEILAEFIKYNIELNNEQTKQTVGEVTYGILKKFKTFLDIELEKSKKENKERNNNNIIGLENSAKIFEPYFARISAIYENSIISAKAFDKEEESTIKSSEKCVKSENESKEIDKNKQKSVKTKKTEMMKASSQKNNKNSENEDIKEKKERKKDNDFIKNVKNEDDDTSSTDSSQISENIKKHNGKRQKSDEAPKNREKIAKEQNKTSVQILKLKYLNPERGMPIQTPKSYLNENDKESERKVINVKEKTTSDKGGRKKKENMSDKSHKRAKSDFYKREKENSLLIEEKSEEIVKKKWLYFKNPDKNNKNNKNKDKDQADTILKFMKDDFKMANVSSLKNYSILPATIICEINSVSFKLKKNTKDTVRISKFSNSVQCRYDLRYGGQFMNKKYLKEKNLQKIFKTITEDNIMSINKMRIEKLSEFKEIKGKPSNTELDCQIINKSDILEKKICSEFVFDNEMIVKLIRSEMEVLVSLITILPKDMESNSSKNKSNYDNIPNQLKCNDEEETSRIKKLINGKKIDNKTPNEKNKSKTETEKEKENANENKNKNLTEKKNENLKEITGENEGLKEWKRNKLDDEKERNAFRLNIKHENLNQKKKYIGNGKQASLDNGEIPEREENFNKKAKVLRAKSHIVYADNKKDRFEMENKKMLKKVIKLINIKNKQNDGTDNSADSAKNDDSSTIEAKLEKGDDINVMKLKKNIDMQNDLDKKFNELKECRIKLRVVPDKNYIGIKNKEYLDSLLQQQTGSFFLVQNTNNDYQIYINYKGKKIAMTHVSSIKGGGYHIYKENIIFYTIDELISYYTFHRLIAYKMQ